MADFREVSTSRWREGTRFERADCIAAEVPVALTYNRRSHVVMMATPSALEDLGLGFSLTEGIIDSPADMRSLHVLPREHGLELAMTIDAGCFERLDTQRRNLTGRTGCGLCGAESLEQAMRAPDPVPVSLRVSARILQDAVSAMPARQALQSVTGAVHCAAWCSLDGVLRELREDVGRHNALDKLIGALGRTGFSPAEGFLVVSSRASYEMVQKAAAAGIELLAAVSAPTTLAVDFATQCGLTLVGFTRPGRHNVYTFPDRVTD